MIYFICGGNIDSYYALDEGEIFPASTGSVYIEEFLEKMNVEHTRLEIHPDLIYGRNGVHCGMGNIRPSNFKTMKEFPKWFYCYNPKKPLIKQLTEEDFIEFISMDHIPYSNGQVETFSKDWYKENGYRD